MIENTRRQFVKGVGTATAMGGLAGCMGGDGGGSSDDGSGSGGNSGGGNGDSGTSTSDEGGSQESVTVDFMSATAAEGPQFSTRSLSSR